MQTEDFLNVAGVSAML